MIVTVTANLALDVTYRIDRLRPNDVHRAASVHQRAGGKGVNVSRVLHVLGHDTRIVGLSGGSTGELIRADLDQAGLRHDLVPIERESRRTVTLVDDDGRATLINEPGPAVSPREWAGLVETVLRSAQGAAVVVLSGSLPAAIAADGYAQLIGELRSRGVPTVLDTSGAALREGVRAGPDVVKPNADELREVTAAADPAAAAAALRELGADNVVVSLGRDGMLAATTEGRWWARPSDTVAGNPTGAGDAAVAALAAGRAAGTRWPDRLRAAVAVSAAAAATPVAGDVDEQRYRSELDAASVRSAQEQEVSRGTGSHR